MAHRDTASFALIAASGDVPSGLAQMLEELGGAGEAGFGGTRFGAGEQSLDAFLASCVAEADPASPGPGRVPQTTYWMTRSGRAVGMLRMRHYLNDALRVVGGHIGYYVAPAERGRGFGSLALAAALQIFRERGDAGPILLTTDSDNYGSIAVIERNGGVLAAQVADPTTGKPVSPYWIEL